MYQGCIVNSTYTLNIPLVVFAHSSVDGFITADSLGCLDMYALTSVLYVRAYGCVAVWR